MLNASEVLVCLLGLLATGIRGTNSMVSILSIVYLFSQSLEKCLEISDEV